MRLLGLFVVSVLVAGTAAPHVARAQALGEAATLSAGVSAAGSGAGSALGRNINGAMRSEGRRITARGKTSTSGGVVNLHWRGTERARYGRTAHVPVRAKALAKTKTGKAEPGFVIYGADAQDTDSEGAAVSQPKADGTAKKDASAGPGGKN